MEKYDLDKNKIKLHNIVIAGTSTIDYDMARYLLLEELEDLGYDEYVVVEGYHCSCYGFDDTEWEAIKYKKDELIKIARDRITQEKDDESDFYKNILIYFGERY